MIHNEADLTQAEHTLTYVNRRMRDIRVTGRAEPLIAYMRKLQRPARLYRGATLVVRNEKRGNHWVMIAAEE